MKTERDLDLPCSFAGLLIEDCTASQVQILGMSIVTLIFALLGFLSPAHRHRASRATAS